MDEDPDYDYEMDPQAAYLGMHGSTEEAMEDVASEVRAMSDAGMHTEWMDKAGIDVDFQDSADRHHGSADLAAPTEALTAEQPAFIENASITVKDDMPSEDQIYELDAVQELSNTAEASFEAPAEAHRDAQVGHGNALEEGDGEIVQDGDDLQSQRPSAESNYAEEEEDELDQEAELSTSLNGVHQPAASNGTGLVEDGGPDDGDDDGEEGLEAATEEVKAALGGHGEDPYGYYHAEDQEVATVRVTFNGQDFVLWSATDISAYLMLAEKAQGADPSQETDELVQVEAPTLEVQQDVLWQPLDSLFASLREKKALGDFLEETHELYISFPDLDLGVAEDNLYCREITLDDLLQLHHGLGLTTSLHIQVAERPRFITKYNELAQHVAGLLGNQLQHSSDDSSEEQPTISAQQHDPLLGNTEEPVQVEAIQPTATLALSESDAETKAILHQAGAGSHGGDVNSAETASGTAANSLSDLVSQGDDGQRLQPSESAPDDASGHARAYPHTSLEVVEGLKEGSHAGDDLQLGQQTLHNEVSQHDSTAKGMGEARVLADEEHEQDEEGKAKGLAQEPLNQDAAEEEASEVSEEDGEEEHALAAEAAGDEEAQEWDVDPEEAGGEWNGEEEQGEDEEYADDGDNLGEEAEQTFYTSINQGSEAEEDELEEPEFQVDEVPHQEGASHWPPSDNFKSTHAYEVAGDEPKWQGRFRSLQMTGFAKRTADSISLSVISCLAISTPEESEEQIVEYTEEQGEGILDAGSPSSATSTSHEARAQRKRGLLEADDDAPYEDGDYEAESKRVKVDA